MNVIETIDGVRAVRPELGRLALVPTMGALHAGHVSLLHLAKSHAQRVAVSIFVNPTQFGPREDYQKYPRPLDADLKKCEDAGVDLVFVPQASEMYPEGTPEIGIDLPSLSSQLEGKHRPGHFKGVSQVVAKLFNIVRPDVAVFGQKDFQQLRILSAMTSALNWPIEIVTGPTLRESDGLAMSSRNVYLSDEERQRALSISRALFLARGEFDSGVRQAIRLTATLRNTLLDSQRGRVQLLIDYVAAVDAMTLQTADLITRPTVLAIAARVGNTRLIDNVVLVP